MNVYENLMNEIRISRTQAFEQNAESSRINWEFNQNNSDSIDNIVIDSLTLSNVIFEMNNIIDDLIVGQLKGVD